MASYIRPSVGTCPTCGKQSYPSKRDAKAHSRRLREKRRGRLHPYKCGEYWHFGHMPAKVTAGKQARDQVAVRPQPPGSGKRCQVCGGSELEHTFPTVDVMRRHEAHEVEVERFEMVPVPTMSDPGAEMPGPPVFVRGNG